MSKNKNKFTVLPENKTVKLAVPVEKTTKDMSKRVWVGLLFMLVGWLLLLLVLTIVFYQVLPTVLALLGGMMGILSKSSDSLHIVDAIIFLLSGASVTAVLTWLYIAVLKRIGAIISNLHQKMSQATRLWFDKKASKKA